MTKRPKKFVKRIETAGYRHDDRDRVEKRAVEVLTDAIAHGNTPIAVVSADGTFLALERTPEDSLALAVVLEWAADALRNWGMQNWRPGPAKGAKS
jgi:archaellum component FlaD/FlaE